MPSILADHNVEGIVERLVRIWDGPEWSGLWRDLGVTLETFASLGLSPDCSDRLLWECCQARGIVLITGNRNARGQNSLEMALRELNGPRHLPILTLADDQRIDRESTYATRVAEAILDRLINLEEYRGVGRLFVP